MYSFMIIFTTPSLCKNCFAVDDQVTRDVQVASVLLYNSWNNNRFQYVVRFELVKKLKGGKAERRKNRTT